MTLLHSTEDAGRIARAGQNVQSELSEAFVRTSQTLNPYFEILKSAEVFRPKSELSEAFIRTLKFEIYVRIHFEL